MTAETAKGNQMSTPTDTPRTDAVIERMASMRRIQGENAMMNHARELERENAALRADKERLDWLTQYASQPIHACWLQFHNAEDMGYSAANGDKPVNLTIKPFGGSPDIRAEGADLRDAIDAAKKSAP